MLMVSNERFVPQKLCDDETSEREELLTKVTCIAVEANSRLSLSPLANLFPLVRDCENGASMETTWFRTAGEPLGTDGSFRIDLAQLIELSLTDAVTEVSVQAGRFIALQRLCGMVGEARKLLDAEFAGFNRYMKLHEIAIVTEDDEPQLLAEFSMLDDELEVRRTRRAGTSPAALVGAIRYAASWHHHRLAILREKRLRKCSLFVDACAQTAIAWGGLSISDVLTQVRLKSWISLPLMRGNVPVATAMLYIANCVLTAEIHSATDAWHLKGTDLILREGLACSDCIEKTGLQDLMKLLPPLQHCGLGEPHASQWTEEDERNGPVFQSTLNLMRTPLFFDDVAQTMAA